MPYTAAAAAYQCRPDVRARRRQWDQDHAAERAPQRAAYRRSVLGRLVQGRQSARWRLRHARSDHLRRQIECLIARYDVEIDRVRHRLAHPHEEAGRTVAAIIAALTPAPA